jgi:uncharacterized RDD family membrane protein YckC
MARRRDFDDEPSLFDLPLGGPAAVAEEPEDGPAEWRAPEEEEPGSPGRVGAAEEVAAAARRRGPAPLSARYLGGLADLAVHLALAVALLFGSRLLGVEAGFADWPAIAFFLLVFSFLYHVLPLAFWGQTPGMAWAGLVARSAGDANLSFGQTARRWLGALLTAALLGLPALPAAGGKRSLADRLSDSDTFLA